eukprot:contig_42884_g9663
MFAKLKNKSLPFIYPGYVASLCVLRDTHYEVDVGPFLHDAATLCEPRTKGVLGLAALRAVLLLLTAELTRAPPDRAARHVTLVIRRVLLDTSVFPSEVAAQAALADIADTLAARGRPSLALDVLAAMLDARGEHALVALRAVLRRYAAFRAEMHGGRGGG